MTPLQTLLAQLVSVAAVQGLIAWWVKSRLEQSVKHEYDRRLEHFRSQEALAVEVAKKRVEVLAEAWNRIALFEAQCWNQSKDLATRLLTEARSRGATGIPNELPSGHKELFDLLTGHFTVELPDDRIEEIDREAEPEQRRLIELADRLDEYLTANRFWLGSELDAELRDYAEQVKFAFVALAPPEEDRREFVRRLRVVVSKRWDARALVTRLAAD